MSSIQLSTVLQELKFSVISSDHFSIFTWFQQEPITQQIRKLIQASALHMCVNPFNSTDRKIGFANSVNPDETAHQDLHCLPFCLQLCEDSQIYNTRHVQFQRKKSPFQKLRGESVQPVFGLRNKQLNRFYWSQQSSSWLPKGDCCRAVIL